MPSQDLASSGQRGLTNRADTQYAVIGSYGVLTRRVRTQGLARVGQRNKQTV